MKYKLKKEALGFPIGAIFTTNNEHILVVGDHNNWVKPHLMPDWFEPIEEHQSLEELDPVDFEPMSNRERWMVEKVNQIIKYLKARE